MPEGPEVIRNGSQLAAMIEGKKLTSCTLVSGKLFRQHGSSLLDPKWTPTVESVKVKGKVIFIKLEESSTIVSTLGMSGWWYPDPATVDPDLMVYYQGGTVRAADVVMKAINHTRLTIRCEDGTLAHYTDPRNFGNVKVVSHAEADRIRDHLGHELIRAGYDARMTIAESIRAKGKDRPIGEVIINQEIVSGLGNIYRAEALYLAGVNPYRRTSQLSYLELNSIIAAATEVLGIAYRHSGTMRYPTQLLHVFLNSPWQERLQLQLGKLSDFSSKPNPTAQILTGHLVYGRSADIFGNEVNRDASGGRTLWWVPAVQV